jgi:hypothetical protein
MKRLILAFVLTFALAFSTSASAGTTTYAVWSYWSAGQGHGASFSKYWWRNMFYKPNPFLTTVTFIDNVSYGWNSTVRNADQTTTTHWFSSQVKKPYCRANVNGPYGACTAYY